jgi:hypothetical protein
MVLSPLLKLKIVLFYLFAKFVNFDFLMCISLYNRLISFLFFEFLVKDSNFVYFYFFSLWFFRFGILGF